MSREPVVPTRVYPGGIAPHMPVEEYQTHHACTCGHGHAVQAQAPAQPIIIKQSDPWVRYMAMGFAGAAVGLMVFASVVAMLIAAGLCALCFAAATWALRGLLGAWKEPKK